MEPKDSGKVRLGIDTGGTFTDVVRLQDGQLTVTKLPSTPADPSRAVLAGMATLRPDGRALDVVHGTTVGLNAVLEGRLAKTAFVTNEGFEDVVQIGRQDRVDLYALEPARVAVPCDPALCFGVRCRRDVTGASIEPLHAAEIERICTVLREAVNASRCEAVAVTLLHSPNSPEDEERLAAALRTALGPDVPVTASAALAPIVGEWERGVTALLNAGMAPIVSRYMARLQAGLEPNDQLRLLRSSGGILSPTEAKHAPARAALSGPAGGVQASELLARALGIPRACAFDMGGTSTDVCLVDATAGTVAVETGTLGSLPLVLPSMPVHTIGCGGGSIAWVDAGGALRVGPHSAGADPGPACYGRGEEPTVTDAHVCLGHLGAETLLDGAYPVDPDRSVRAFERLAQRLGITAERAAHGVLQVAETAMARALGQVTVSRAVDARHVPLIAYGGAGGLHAAGLRTLLGMPSAFVPEHAGAFSAVGLACAGDALERIVPLHQTIRKSDAAAFAAAETEWTQASNEALQGLRRGCQDPDSMRLELALSLRWEGQGASLQIPWHGSLDAAVSDFVTAHRAINGFAPESEPDRSAVEAVDLRVALRGAGPRVHDALVAQDDTNKTIAIAVTDTTRTAPIGEKCWPIYRMNQLPEHCCIRSPALVESPTGTTVLPPGHELRRLGPVLRIERTSKNP